MKDSTLQIVWWIIIGIIILSLAFMMTQCAIKESDNQTKERISKSEFERCYDKCIGASCKELCYKHFGDER